MFQFMNCALGFGVEGKKARTNAKARKTIEMILSGRPYLPSLKRDGSSGSLRHLFNKMHQMDTMYEDRIAHSESEAMLLKATVEPMLIRESKHDTANDTRIALTGMSQPGRT